VNNIKCMFSVARSEYVKWITNPRIIIIGVLIIFMRTLAVEPLIERAEKIDLSLDILEPFAAVGNSGMLVMLMPCVFMVLVSDYPKMTGNTLFFVQRTGRWNWFAGHILFLIFTVFSFLLIVLIGCIFVSDGNFTGKWSDVVTKYDAFYPNEAGNFTSQLLPSNLYNQIPLIITIIQTISLMAAYLFLLTLIIYFFKLIHVQSISLLVAIFIIAAGVVTCSLKIESMWLFPMANTIVWLHYDEILNEPNFPIWYSYFYFVIAIAAFITLNSIAVKRLEFINIEQVE